MKKAKVLISTINRENVFYNQTVALLITTKKILEKENGLRNLLGEVYQRQS